MKHLIQRSLVVAIAASLLSWVSALPAAAQQVEPPDFPNPDLVSQPTRFTAGLAFSISQPKEEFRFNVGNGYGATGGVQYNLDRSGWTSLRFDVSWLRYGHENRRVPFSQSVTSRITVDVSTTNSILGLSGGPELALPDGPIRPYLNAAFGGLMFRTTSTVSETGIFGDDIASTTNHRDWTSAWVLGSGLRIPFGEGSPASLDIGVRYHRGGEASYLRGDSIVDNPDGSITINPFQSRTPFIVYSIGVRYRFSFSSEDPCPRSLC